MKDHHINIFYSDEDGCYIADIPDLEFCSAFGATPEKALAQVKKAKRAWLETAKAEGRPIPEPHYRPLIYQAAHEPAGRYSLSFRAADAKEEKEMLKDLEDLKAGRVKPIRVTRTSAYKKSRS